MKSLLLATAIVTMPLIAIAASGSVTPKRASLQAVSASETAFERGTSYEIIPAHRIARVDTRQADDCESNRRSAVVRTKSKDGVEGARDGRTASLGPADGYPRPAGRTRVIVPVGFTRSPC